MAETARLILPTERNVEYINWIKVLSQRFEEALPFPGPVDMAMTLGSGLSPSLEALQLRQPTIIPFSDIGLPEGSNTAHLKTIVAGYTPNNKSVIAFTGRTALFEVPPEGVDTESGHVNATEAAGAYLDLVNIVGAENLILTTAAGGINHPKFPFQKAPFPKDKLPVVGVIGADLMVGYPIEHMGHHQGEHGTFFALQDGDEELSANFIHSMNKASGVDVAVLYYASIPAAFEDRGLAHFLAINGVQAIGMTYGGEKTHLSGMKRKQPGNKGGIGRFAGVVVITDDVELYDPRNPNRRIPISVAELRWRSPQDFKIKNPATDEQVRATAALANNRLGAALVHLVDNV